MCVGVCTYPDAGNSRTRKDAPDCEGRRPWTGAKLYKSRVLTPVTRNPLHDGLSAVIIPPCGTDMGTLTALESLTGLKHPWPFMRAPNYEDPYFREHEKQQYSKLPEAPFSD